MYSISFLHSFDVSDPSATLRTGFRLYGGAILQWVAGRDSVLEGYGFSELGYPFFFFRERGLV
jgi:hypothetical protein